MAQDKDRNPQNPPPADEQPDTTQQAPGQPAAPDQPAAPGANLTDAPGPAPSEAATPPASAAPPPPAPDAAAASGDDDAMARRVERLGGEPAPAISPEEFARLQQAGQIHIDSRGRVRTTRREETEAGMSLRKRRAWYARRGC